MNNADSRKRSGQPAAAGASAQVLPSHSELPTLYTWNAPSVFPSEAAWAAELSALEDTLPALKHFEGRLGHGPEILHEAMKARDAVLERMGKLGAYALMAHQVDTSDQNAARMYSRVQALLGRAMAAIAFIEPELIQIGQETLSAWLATEESLSYLKHYVEDLFRKQAHVRSKEVEELLGMLAEPFSGPQLTMGMLTDADFAFPHARAAGGDELPVTQGTLMKILSGSDRQARQAAWEGYHDTYLAFKNTLAANLATSIKQNVFVMRGRRHGSTLEAALFPSDIPKEVFHNLIATFRQNLPTWHRYWEVRRRALGVDVLHPYDMWAPLAIERPEIAFEQAVELICRGLEPMGRAYVETMRRGCLEDRWVDVYPCRGKAAGAFSAGSRGTHPFILMSYNDDVLSLSTLAHELGHSMHSYLSWESQPAIYGDYSMFAAEVASNFHQAMVRAYLLESNPDGHLQLALLEEALSNFHRYFFIMPTLARFELEVHQREEQGRGVTADDMIVIMADLLSEAYGAGVYLDRERSGIMWATFPHLFADYYVFQYATGISGAHALAHRVRGGAPGAVEGYLRFLKAGGSRYPLDALKSAGVDLSKPEAVEQTFAELSRYIDRLEAILEASQQ